MSPILPGIFASGISGHLVAPWSPVGTYEAIAAVELTAGVSTINFTVPSGYKKLVLKGTNLSATLSSGIVCRFNNDNSSSYHGHGVDANGASTNPSSFTNSSDSKIYIGYTGNASYPAPFIAEIFDADSTTKTKTTRVLSGNYTNGEATSYFTTIGATWTKLDPINLITITHGSGIAFNSGSTFYLYGVR